MKVGVLMGGTSDERDVSLASGTGVAAALREAGHEVVAVDTVRGILSKEEEDAVRDRGVGNHPPLGDELRELDAGRIVRLVRDDELDDVDVFFMALHGGTGENGTVQAVLDAAGVLYTGSDRLGCSLAMDKEVTKRLLRDAGVPTPAWLTGPRTAGEVEAGLGLPVIVKASGGGSSLRLVLAHDMKELDEAIRESRGWGDVVLFEQFVTGREVTVGVLGDETLPVGEIVPEHELFDYECKYQPGMAQEIFPADLPEALARRLGELALEVHRTLRLRDYCRVDFMIDDAGEPWCLEANTLPGMTGNSLLPKGAKAAGISFPELCDRIVVQAMARKDAGPT